MITVPMCWKCRDGVFADVPEEEVDGITPTTMVGCNANQEIKDYNDAETMCPIIGVPSLPKETDHDGVQINTG